MNDLLVKFFVAGLLGGALVAAQVEPAAVAAACTNQFPTQCGTNPITGAAICVDTFTDENNCGTCGNACPGSQVCVGGAGPGGIGGCVCPDNWPGRCSYSNSTGSTISVCHNFTRSEVACGGCGNTCSASTECVSGACKCTSPTATSCPDTITKATYCVKNITTSDDHCNGCFNTCPTGQSCTNGACTCPASKPVQCPWGTASICVNNRTSETHCGSCWNRCGYDEKCIEGKCTKTCGEKSKLCPVPGTSISLCAKVDGDDEYHCGDCFKVCPRSQSCRGGNCVCTGGRTAVPVGPNKVVRCVDTRTSNTACGKDLKVCPSNLICKSGECKCPTRDRPNECPTTGGQVLCFNFRTDKSACGGCFNQCAASQKCRDGKCVN